MIELLIVIAIAAILAGFAAPGMGVFIKNNRLRGVSFDLMASLNYARSEAVTRKSAVVICRTDDPTAGTPVCLTSGGSAWSQGWLVFVNNDDNLTFDPADTLLRRVSQTSATVSVTADGKAADALQFLTDGSLDANGSSASLYVCDARGGGYGRELEVAAHGRAQTIAGTATAPTPCL